MSSSHKVLLWKHAFWSCPNDDILWLHPAWWILPQSQRTSTWQALCSYCSSTPIMSECSPDVWREWIVQVSRSMLPTKLLFSNVFVKPFLLYSIYPSHNKIIFCSVTAVFDIVIDVWINCSNSRSNPTSKLKWLSFRKVWNLMWASLLPVSWHLTPFLLDKLCHCIFSLPLSSDNTCLSAPLPSSSLPKLCSRPDKICLVKVITFPGQSLTLCTRQPYKQLGLFKNLLSYSLHLKDTCKKLSKIWPETCTDHQTHEG